MKTTDTLKKITDQLKRIFEESPDFTGNITLDFCLGGLTNIKKTEKIKIK